MQGDDAFRDYRIATYRYDSPFGGRTSTIQEISTRMLRQLEDADVFRKYSEIYFITHSMGGLVTKRVLVNLNNPERLEKLRLIKAVLYIATPAQGAEIADVGTWVGLNPQFRDMQSADFNSYLQNLEDEWAILMRQRGDQRFPQSFCAYETKPLYGRIIVNRIRAATSCDDTPIAFDEDHITIVKPLSRQSAIYEWARRRIQDASELARGVSTTSFEKRIEDLLRRNEFLRDRDKDVGTATFLVQLKRPYTPDELGHFRILLEVIGRRTKDSSVSTLSFAARDAYPILPSGQRLQKRDGQRMAVWSKNPDLKFPGLVFSGRSSFGPNISLIRVAQEINHRGPFQTIESFNRTGLSIFVNESLADKLAFVGFAVDNYLLIGLHIDCLEQTKGNPVEWPFELSQSEQAIGWLNLIARRYWPNDNSRPPFRPGLGIDFDKFIPTKADSPGSWSIAPGCELSDVGPPPPRE